MLNDILRSEHSKQLSLLSLVVSSSRFAPDISKVAVSTPRPSGSARILDIQPTVQRHAVRSSLVSVDGALAFVAHRRGARLSRKQQRVHIRLARRRDAVSDEGNEQRHQRGRVAIPLAHKASKAGVDALEETHLGADAVSLREQKERSFKPELWAVFLCTPLIRVEACNEEGREKQERKASSCAQWWGGRMTMRDGPDSWPLIPKISR